MVQAAFFHQKKYTLADCFTNKKKTAFLIVYFTLLFSFDVHIYILVFGCHRHQN